MVVGANTAARWEEKAFHARQMRGEEIVFECSAFLANGCAARCAGELDPSLSFLGVIFRVRSYMRPTSNSSFEFFSPSRRITLKAKISSSHALMMYPQELGNQHVPWSSVHLNVYILVCTSQTRKPTYQMSYEPSCAILYSFIYHVFPLLNSAAAARTQLACNKSCRLGIITQDTRRRAYRRRTHFYPSTWSSELMPVSTEEHCAS